MDVEVGKVYYHIGADRGSLGRSPHSGSVRQVNNRKLEVVKVYFDDQKMTQVCDVKLISGHPADIGTIVQGVPTENLVSDITWDLGNKPHVYRSELSTILIGPMFTGGINPTSNAAEILHISEKLLCEGHNIYPPALIQFLLVQPGTPLADWLTPMHWKSYYTTLLRRCEQILYYLPENWRDSMELIYAMDLYEKLGRTNFTFQVDLSGNITRFPGE